MMTGIPSIVGVPAAKPATEAPIVNKPNEEPEAPLADAAVGAEPEKEQTPEDGQDAAVADGKPEGEQPHEDRQADAAVGAAKPRRKKAVKPDAADQ